MESATSDTAKQADGSLSLNDYLEREKKKKQRRTIIFTLILAFACINFAFLTAFTGDASEELVIEEEDAVPTDDLFSSIPDICPIAQQFEEDQLVIHWMVNPGLTDQLLKTRVRVRASAAKFQTYYEAKAYCDGSQLDIMAA